MQKGKYGVCLWFYALVAFILGVFRPGFVGAAFFLASLS